MKLKTIFVNFYNNFFDLYLHIKDNYYKKKLGTPLILSIDNTIEKIVNEKCSVSRFGDGELKIASGQSIRFQKYDEELAKRLREILISNYSNHMVCITDIFDDLSWMMPKSYQYTWHIVAEYRKLWTSYLDMNKSYGNTFITRCYIDFKDKSNTQRWFENLKKIWQYQDIIIVEGEKSRLGCGNDLFESANSITRILCPVRNAFTYYDEILEVVKKQSKDKMILLALGPTATVLAYDLAKEGFRAIDIGHIDIEYEWFRSKALSKVKIEGKYTNEAENGDIVLDNIDEKYINEIKYRIGC